MSIEDNGTRDQFIATAGQTVFPYSFEIFDKADITVDQDGSVLAEGTNYTVSGVGNDNGGNITLIVGATTGDILTLFRDMELVRVTDYQNAGDFLADEVDDDFDRLWAATQQNDTTNSLSIRARANDPILNSSNTELAVVATRASKALGFAPDGTIDYLNLVVAVAADKTFDTVAVMAAATGFSVGDIARTKEYFAASGIGGGNYDVVLTSGVTPNAKNIIISSADPLLSFVLVVGTVAIAAQFGAREDGVTDDTANIKEAINAAPTIILGKSRINSIDLTADTQPSITLILTAELKLIDNATVPAMPLDITAAIICGARDYFEIRLNGHTIDCNKDGQTFATTYQLMFVESTGVDNFKVTNGIVKNVCGRFINNGLSTYKTHLIEAISFEEGTLHTGTLNQGSGFIALFGGSQTSIINCQFVHTALPLANENRNPSAIFISGANGDKKLLVRGCFFKNLGHHAGGNQESPIDLYSYAQTVEYDNNHFVDSTYIPFRATNAGEVRVTNNVVEQNVQIIIDGGAPDLDAACYVGGIVDRGFTVNQKDNTSILLKNNKFTIGVSDCTAATFSNSLTTQKVHRVAIENCDFTVTGSSNKPGILVNLIKDFSIRDSTIDGFVQQPAIKLQQTDIAPYLTDTTSATINNCVLSNCDHGVFARLSVTNLRVSIKDSDLSIGMGTGSYSARDVETLSITNTKISSADNGDTSNIGAFFFQNNECVSITPPAGFQTNTFYKITGNAKLPDHPFSMSIPRYPTASILDRANVVNTAQKIAGTIIMNNTTNEFLIAVGQNDNSPWHDGANVLKYTPV